jgi:alkanesulfonate monooxygenase SsuD/methylene tetrahydromethanopterin reductase-like flavin-dependent oxidoreductase (luciferase family)
MRIGLVNQLHGRPGGKSPAPDWESITHRASAAERVGFDSFVFEDALLYRGKEATNGVWESMSIAAALAASTTDIHIGQSVINSPYRSPAMTASLATTLDEISGGRYIFGIGAGNTPDSDYEAFGFPTDHRYSRFAEAIEIIHSLLKTGKADFDGEYYTVRDAELVLRGPHPQGPPINIAAGSPKMLRLAAKYGDAWNWWGWDETLEQLSNRLKPIIDQLEQACEATERDPADLVRTVDVYTVVPEAFRDSDRGDLGMEKPVLGSSQEISEFLLGLGELGFEEARVDLWPKTTAAIEAMEPVVSAVHGD